MSAARQAQEKELTTLNRQLDTAHDLLEQGVYPIPLYKERTEALRGRISEAEKKIQEITHQIEKASGENEVIKVFIPQVKQMLSDYDSLSAPKKNELLREIIEKAVYNKEKSAAFKGVAVDDFDLELFVKLPVKDLQ